MSDDLSEARKRRIIEQNRRQQELDREANELNMSRANVVRASYTMWFWIAALAIVAGALFYQWANSHR